jgi:hypothetical protein
MTDTDVRRPGGALTVAYDEHTVSDRTQIVTLPDGTVLHVPRNGSPTSARRACSCSCRS